jgi:hypothetical protein
MVPAIFEPAGPNPSRWVRATIAAISPHTSVRRAFSRQPSASSLGEPFWLKGPTPTEHRALAERTSTRFAKGWMRWTASSMPIGLIRSMRQGKDGAVELCDGIRVSSDFIAAIFVGGALGWFLDSVAGNLALRADCPAFVGVCSGRVKRHEDPRSGCYAQGGMGSPKARSMALRRGDVTQRKTGAKTAKASACSRR